ncbi:MAG TPA: glucose/galactose MFS transporter, partial [Sunxiuqinia sp.]|nr:glucose/galactose MFS transporter [Sunxiuqinia sp.]
AEQTAALNELARRVINPYLVMTLVLVLMGIAVRLAPLPDLETEQEDELETSLISIKKNIFAFPHLILGVLALFLYVGVEVIAGDTIIRYGLSLGIPLETAKHFTSYTMMAMIAGYILGIILIPKTISQQTALKISAVLGVVLTLGVVTFNGIGSVTFVALLGLANAIVWPAIWPLAIHNLGQFIKTGSALLIMAIAGGALMPLLWGKLSDSFGSQQAYWILIPSYLFILYYAVKGHKIKHWKTKIK